MRPITLALFLVAACGPPIRQPVIGPVIGQSTAPGPTDPSRPVVSSPGVTEGGGHLNEPVGTAPGSVTPAVGDKPSTVDQTSGQDASDRKFIPPTTPAAPGTTRNDSTPGTP